MPHSLAVRADGPYIGGAELRRLKQLVDHIGIDPHERVGRQRGAVQLVRPAGVERQQLGLERGGKRQRCEARHAQPITFEFDQCPIHAVE